MADSQKHKLTVGSLLKDLSRFPRDTPVTFGSSRWTARTLIFYRFKIRGPESLQIELSELSEFGAGPEHESRITAGYIVDYLSGLPPQREVFFGCTMDACPLELESVTPAVSFNLAQPESPKYVVDGIAPAADASIRHHELKEIKS